MAKKEKPAVRRIEDRDPRAKEIARALLQSCSKKPESAVEAYALVRDAFSGIIEDLLKAEMAEHLGYEKSSSSPKQTSNRRNGSLKKTVLTKDGQIEIEVPRDREGSFEPKIVPKRTKDVSSIQDKVIAMYARGMSDRDISNTIADIYGFELSPETISNMTEAVKPRLQAWKDRSLKAIYPFVFIDALYVDVKVERSSQKMAVYVAIARDENGVKDVLGFWIRETESAKEWLGIFDELKQRGVRKITVISADGLKGMEQAVETAFGQNTKFQRCIVHMIRNSVQYLPRKHYREFCSDLKAIYAAVSLEAAEMAKDTLQCKWEKSYPGAVRVWVDNFKFVAQLFEFPADIRKIIYTTNVIESVNNALRKVTRFKGCLPSVAALEKLLYLRIQALTETWTDWVPGWAGVRAALNIICPDWNQY